MNTGIDDEDQHVPQGTQQGAFLHTGNSVLETKDATGFCHIIEPRDALNLQFLKYIFDKNVFLEEFTS